MTRIFITAVVSVCSAGAFAAGPSCKEQADDLKLVGTALTGFMASCERDATASCDASALASKLTGAARLSFAKKCVEVAVGTNRCAHVLRDSFRPQLMVRSIATEEESASCYALCGSGSPLGVGCDGAQTAGSGDGMQRRVDLE